MICGYVDAANWHFDGVVMSLMSLNVAQCQCFNELIHHWFERAKETVAGEDHCFI